MNYVIFEDGNETNFYKRGYTESDLTILKLLGEKFGQTIMISFDGEDVTFVATLDLVEVITKIFGPGQIKPLRTVAMLTYKN